MTNNVNQNLSIACCNYQNHQRENQNSKMFAISKENSASDRLWRWFSKRPRQLNALADRGFCIKLTWLLMFRFCLFSVKFQSLFFDCNVYFMSNVSECILRLIFFVVGVRKRFKKIKLIFLLLIPVIKNVWKDKISAKINNLRTYVFP